MTGREKLIEIQYDEKGRIKHNGERYTEIKKLDRLLTGLGIRHEMHELFDGYQICVPEDHQQNSFEGDAIQHRGSYGAEQDLIEVYGFNLDGPDGYLTAEAALVYFQKWHLKEKKEG